MGHYRCGIYDQRPEMCRRYPESGSYIPQSCTFYFTEAGRQGSCDPDCNASCCFLPRLGGEPGGAPMPEIAGGEPCKHILYIGVDPAQPGSERSSIREIDTAAGGDREGHRPVAEAIELVLAAKRGGEGSSSGSPKVGL
jgi:hypothetical protein